MKTYTTDEIIEMIRKEIRATNLYDGSTYNVGYRDGLRELMLTFKNDVDVSDYGK